MPVHIAPYGDFAVNDGDILLMDHNSGSLRVHVMTISRDFHGMKLSWADRPGPRAEVETADFPIGPDERQQILAWSSTLWGVAASGHVTLPHPPPDGTPPYEWAVVMRRGADLRVIEGAAGQTVGDDTESAIEGAVDYLDMHF